MHNYLDFVNGYQKNAISKIESLHIPIYSQIIPFTLNNFFVKLWGVWRWGVL